MTQPTLSPEKPGPRWGPGFRPSPIIEYPESDGEPMVPYLFLYDPLAEYLDPPLQGKRLGTDGVYRPICAPAGGALPCPPLGLALLLDDEGRLQFRNLEPGKLIERMPAALERVEKALKQAIEARTRAEQALERAAEARTQAEQARTRAEQALVEAEKRDRERLAEIERLKALLGQAR